MTARITALMSNEMSVSNVANTVNIATLVRVFAANTSVVTVANANSIVYGTMTIPSGAVEYISKKYDDTLTASVAVLCTKIAFRG